MIEIRLFATLRERREKIIKIEFKENITGEDILKDLNISKKDVSIFLINGFHSSLDKKLSNGDIISIFPPVGGG
ncbi:MoaD/ThiS family protein [Cetobacterium sp. 2A]|uniref:MoaD/ThiS family protein n=1 Tax=Cetobacterium sp. 2A TaxID=2754723 RepID=UPI00163D0F11|nr:MoaD/ThiS family protein [Cetobacterium sp. 2A]MBC2857170.1 MoaD/ThiS family protein [Cetobacterium sp. 2A]